MILPGVSQSRGVELKLVKRLLPYHVSMDIWN